ncbi:MAG: hypothetical protein IPK19_19475 [Chloroflexi bacterium]|nr:hypothetical protein [Chloroflexota bacterium]
MIARLRGVRLPSASSLALALTLLIAFGALVVALAEAQILRYVDFIYVLGENALVLGALLCVIFALVTRGEDAEGAALPASPILPALIALTVGALGIILLARYQEGLSPYDVLIAVLIALSLDSALTLLRRGAEVAELDIAPGLPRGTAAGLLAGIGVILILTVALRLLGPGNLLLVYLLAPLTVFVAPGLALSLALLDPDAPPLAHVALAPVLSVAVGAIWLAWLAWLNIPITPVSILGGIAAVTVLGAADALFRRRSTPADS